MIIKLGDNVYRGSYKLVTGNYITQLPVVEKALDHIRELISFHAASGEYLTYDQHVKMQKTDMSRYFSIDVFNRCIRITGVRTSMKNDQIVIEVLFELSTFNDNTKEGLMKELAEQIHNNEVLLFPRMVLSKELIDGKHVVTNMRIVTFDLMPRDPQVQRLILTDDLTDRRIVPKKGNEEDECISD